MASRTVTFLFTDIEGSTRLWDESPQTMGPALARHDALMREAVAVHGGETFKTVGDAFCVAFEDAPGAMAAALAAQIALAEETWPTPRPIRVRMALHTGTAEARDRDYFGPPLNRVARLLSTGHGGQTILSSATYELVRDALPGGASLTPLGEHRLKDLARPEAVYGLLHPALPKEFAPLRSLDSETLPNNLPEQTTSFVGREEELRKVAEALKRSRLLTLAGPGGTGKTRLALQAAAEAVDAFPGGVWLVELAPLTDPALVAQTVAGVLGLAEEAGKPLVITLADRLKKAPTLLVLDNCEHLLDAAARLADALVKAVPSLKILATGREPLGVGGENVHRVPTLSLPPRNVSGREAVHTPESLSHFEAVRLFIERATAQKRDFAVTNANAPALASLCLHLDGIPLAIELAAARIRSLSVEQVDARLDDRFRLLTGGSRTSLPRQQTLRALVEWSHDLLNDAERAAFRRLAVFAGGWTLEAAEAVAVGEGVEDWEVLDLLTSLVDKSLVVVEEAEGAVRYGMLETIREYAAEKLRESGEAGRTQAAHFARFRDFAEASWATIRGEDQVRTLDRLEREHDNFRAALAWAATPEGQGTRPEAELGLAAWLRPFWDTRGYWREGRERLEAALARPAERPDSEDRARALLGAGVLANNMGDLDRARSLYEGCLAIRRDRGDRPGVASVAMGLGNVATQSGDFAAAHRWFDESLAVARGLDSPFLLAGLLGNVAILAEYEGDQEALRRCNEECLAIFRGLGDAIGIATTLRNLAAMFVLQGDFRAAALALAEGLDLAWRIGDKRVLYLLLGTLGRAEAAQGRLVEGVRLMGLARRLMNEAGADRFSYMEEGLRTAREGLDDAAFESAQAEGAAMDPEAVLAYALSALPESPRTSP